LQVAAWKPNGRAADIFSLGCILLEISVLHDQGTLHHMRQNRSADPSFHANLNSVDAWLSGPVPRPWSARRVHLVQEIKAMLTRDPALRPTAKQLLVRVTGYDLAHASTSGYSLFSDCCKSQFIRIKDHERDIARYKRNINNLISDNEWAHTQLKDSQILNRRIAEERDNCKQQLLDAQVSTEITELYGY
jgi:serine/threonine protein kinase